MDIQSILKNMLLFLKLVRGLICISKYIIYNNIDNSDTTMGFDWKQTPSQNAGKGYVNIIWDRLFAFLELYKI